MCLIILVSGAAIVSLIHDIPPSLRSKFLSFSSPLIDRACVMCCVAGGGGGSTNDSKLICHNINGSDFIAPSANNIFLSQKDSAPIPVAAAAGAVSHMDSKHLPKGTAGQPYHFDVKWIPPPRTNRANSNDSTAQMRSKRVAATIGM